jgi:DMSO/TMAO reductase YedYZ molybdopterin-dependent catalytic subunit
VGYTVRKKCDGPSAAGEGQTGAVSTSVKPPVERDPAIGWGFAALIGLLAVAAAIGAGQLVGGLLSASSAPFIAVGDATVRVSPQFLVEFAKTTFGTADKPVLLAGMAVVIALIAAAGGMASRRSRTPGSVVVGVLGVVSLLAVISSPTFSPLDLAAPAASLAVGLIVFRRLHDLQMQVGHAVNEDQRQSRRRMLIGTSAAIGAGAVAASGVGAWIGRDVTGSRDQVTAALAKAGYARAPQIPPTAAFPDPGTTPFVTANADFYRIDAALRVPQLTAADWSLHIHGMVDREISLSFSDLLARPLVEKTVTLLCVSDPVGGPYISTTNFIGVDLRQILVEAGISPDAEQLLSTSSDGWTAGTPTDVLLEPGRGALLAVGMNGEALPAEHGFPVRMVVPGLYGYVSATKWVVDMEVTTFDQRESYWVERGWAEKAPIKTESRIDVPGGQRVAAGKLVVAGTAWSQPIGISKVEVRMDNGAWQQADLGTEVNTVTWRMWRTTFDVPPGTHRFQVRATDHNGVTQTEQLQDVVPDGATGWHTIQVSAS